MTVTINLRTIVAFAGGLGVALIAVFVFQAWQVDAAPGDTDATLVPITPCRLIDTRPGDDRVGTHAAFGVGDIRTIVAHGTNGKCTIPSDAVGLSLNVTALGATDPSFLTIWPAGTMPKASSLNPGPGQPPTPNAVTTTLSGAGSFDVFNKAGTVNVIIDVNGYYTKTSLQELQDQINALKAVDSVLEAAQPFAVTARTDSVTVETVEETVSVEVTAPVDGHVTVNSSGQVSELSAGTYMLCSIGTTDLIDIDYRQVWESAGIYGSSAQLAGTRTFEVAGGSTTTFKLACQHLGIDLDTSIANIVLTAIFTPAP